MCLSINFVIHLSIPTLMCLPSPLVHNIHRSNRHSHWQQSFLQWQIQCHFCYAQDTFFTINPPLQLDALIYVAELQSFFWPVTQMIDPGLPLQSFRASSGLQHIGYELKWMSAPQSWDNPNAPPRPFVQSCYGMCS